MACRATRQRSDVVFFDEFPAERELIGGRSILHVEDLLARADKELRRAMALETPVHVQRVHPPRERHLIDPAMAGDATDALVHVNAMIEINKSRQVVDARPLDRLTRAKTLSDRRQRRAVRPDLSVTIHADFRRGDPGERAFFHRRVAVAAVDAIICDVMFVTKRDRLGACDSYFRDIGGAIERRKHQCQGDDKPNPAENADPGDRVRARVKNLRHQPEPYDCQMPRNARASSPP